MTVSEIVVIGAGIARAGAALRPAERVAEPRLDECRSVLDHFRLGRFN